MTHISRIITACVVNYFTVNPCDARQLDGWPYIMSAPAPTSFLHFAVPEPKMFANYHNYKWITVITDTID